jgi:transglutaminase-like putative cysteine protease
VIRPDRTSTIWVMATFTLAMLPQFTRMPLAVAAMTLLPLLWRTGAEFRGWRPLPPLLRHALTVVALAVLFLSYGSVSGRRSAVSLLTLMLAFKLIEGFSIRDCRLIVSFSLFLCGTQFLFSQGLTMPLYGAAVILIALVALTRLQRSEAWAHEAGGPPPVRASLLSELGFGMRLLAIALPAGLAFFVLFPRLGSPLWGIPESTLDSKTGLSDSMSPGSVQQLFMDDSPAFRAAFDGAAPPPGDLYWRGPVFWRFDGRTWKGGFYGKNVGARARPPAATAPWSYAVQLEPNERKWLFALDYPATTPKDTRLTLDYQLIRRKPVTQLLEYSVRSDPDFVDSPELSEPLRLQATDVPERSSPRTRELVDRWRRETPDDRALVERVLNHFNQQPFRYSLNVPLLGSQPVDEFLFETRTGYCEHYASAFAVMMRVAGIPTRVVTGYLGGWYNQIGDYLLVRQSDAHAWTEVWLPGNGWTRVDPTAAVSPLRIEQGSLEAVPGPRHLFDYNWLRRLRNGADIVQRRWNDWVIEYGAREQARLFEPLGIDRMTPAMLVAALLLVIAITGAILFPLILRIRGPARLDPVQRAWRKFLRRLRKAGFTSAPSRGAIETAAAVAQRLPAQTLAARRIAELYTRCRYASGTPPVADLRRAVRDFRPGRKTGRP